MTWRILIGAALLVGISATARAEDDTHVARGRDIANKICLNCHVVGPNQKYAPVLRQPGPDFREVAKRSGVDKEFLEHFLAATHGDAVAAGMPNPSLTPEMISDVTAYILSLKGK